MLLCRLDERSTYATACPKISITSIRVRSSSPWFDVTKIYPRQNNEKAKGTSQHEATKRTSAEQTYVQTVDRLEPDEPQRDPLALADLVLGELDLLRDLGLLRPVEVERGLVDDELDGARCAWDVLGGRLDGDGADLDDLVELYRSRVGTREWRTSISGQSVSGWL